MTPTQGNNAYLKPYLENKFIDHLSSKNICIFIIFRMSWFGMAMKYVKNANISKAV